MSGIISILSFIVAMLALGFLSAGIGPAAWIALIFLGAAGRVTNAKAAFTKVLMADERLITLAVQHRALALFNRRALLGITTSRVVVMKRGLLGGFKMTDIQWKDLVDATIEQNVLGDLCGSNLKFKHIGRPTTAIDVMGVPNDLASEIYAKAQHEEQAWEEKRRVRAMEEVRAASGGVFVNTGAPAAGGGGRRITEELEKAKALFDTGAISDAEYQEIKSKILAG